VFLFDWNKPGGYLIDLFAASRELEPNKTLQLTPSRIAFSSADKSVLLFRQPAVSLNA